MKFLKLFSQYSGYPSAWGYNWAGQLGNGTNYNSNLPIQFLNLTDVVAIATGTYHSVAVKTNFSCTSMDASYCLQCAVDSNCSNFRQNFLLSFQNHGHCQ